MKFRTELKHIPLKRPIDLGEKIFMVGSCFTGNIGGWLAECWLPVTINPWGVLYNPASIAEAVSRVAGKDDSFVPDFHLVQNSLSKLWCSFDHHGLFDGKDADAVMQNLLDTEKRAVRYLNDADHIIITFGTSWVFERDGNVVANCHKFPASQFVHRRMSVNEIVTLWRDLLSTPALCKKHVVFTVSPIRHVADGLHGNQLSKATLLLAVDELCSLFPDQVEYLPSYELLIDDLRDYRFYADDMVHPSTFAVNAIKELVADVLMTPELRQYMSDAEPIVKAMAHRPSDPNDPEYREFIIKTEQKRQELLARLRSNKCSKK